MASIENTMSAGVITKAKAVSMSIAKVVDHLPFSANRPRWQSR
jgi:hypothetical protein